MIFDITGKSRTKDLISGSPYFDSCRVEVFVCGCVAELREIVLFYLRICELNVFYLDLNQFVSKYIMTKLYYRIKIRTFLFKKEAYIA